ncbi:MAG: BACON domain-containing protein, partial [Desulfobulbaceae bacterium]
MFTAWPVLAAVMPAFTHLAPIAPIASKLKAPGSVTVDANGRIYVAETGTSLVQVYSQSGGHVHTISGLAQPISLAVDAGGRIYIGNRDRGNVEVYDPSFEYRFTLGQGNGEFGQPNDIDIDASGLIYVVDKTRSVIRIYNPDGTSNTTIGQPGNGNGQFHHPVSLAMDAVRSELVVMDLQQVEDATGMIDGARIQFLEMNGAFKRGYTKFGYDREGGQLVIPRDVAVDGQSRVYVTDSRLQKVMVYDNYGVFLGMIDDATQPFLTPLGLALGGSNKLYVASLRGGRVEVYGIDSYIEMGVSPAGLSFEELQGASSGATQSIVINNTGNSTFTWTASSAAPWLVLPVTRDSIPAASLRAIEVGVNIDNLDPGQYRGSVTISAGTAAAETVAVNLTVLPNAKLSVAPTSLNFVSMVGTSPAAQTLSIENAGGGTLNWNANVDQSWLTLNATSGTAPSSLKVYADITSLAAGSYSGTVTISKQGDTPEMQRIPVTLVLTEPAGPVTIPPPVINPNDKSRHLKWTTRQVLPGTTLHGVWGESSANLYAVGAKGAILHYNGKTWTGMESGVTESLYGIWGSSATDVYAVGEKGVIVHFDGTSWSAMPVVVPETFRAAWGSSADNAYAVSRNGSILESFSAVTATGVAL